MNADMSWQTPKPSAELASQEVEQLPRLEKHILEAVALGEDIQIVLDQLCTSAEAMIDNSVAWIMLYNENLSGLNVAAAPSIPQEAIEALNGLVPGEQAGSCGTAVFTASPTIVCDTLSDSCWEPLRKFARDFDIGACWSIPIKINDGEVVGSFALSSFKQRASTPHQAENRPHVYPRYTGRP